MTGAGDIYTFINKFRSEHFEFDRKDNPDELLAVIREHSQTLIKFATDVNSHGANTKLLENFKINLEKLLNFLIAEKNLTTSRTIADVLKAVRQKPAINVLNELCTDHCEFDKYDHDDLFGLIGRNIDFFRSIKIDSDHSKEVILFNNNLEKLFIYLIQKDLAELSPQQIAAHFANIQLVLLPFLDIFPNLNKHILISVRHALAHPGLNIGLDAFIKELIAVNPQVSLSFIASTSSRTDAAAQNDFHKVNEQVRQEIQKRAHEWLIYKPIYRLKTTYNSIKKDLNLKVLIKIHESKNESHKSEPLSYPKATLTDIWLDVATRFHNPHDEQMAIEILVTFFEIYLALTSAATLNRDPVKDAISIVLPMLNKGHRIFSDFLEMRTGVYGDFYRRQYEVMNRLPKDLQQFHEFLEKNQDHKKLFESKLLAVSRMPAKHLQTLGLLRAPATVTVETEIMEAKVSSKLF